MKNNSFKVLTSLHTEWIGFSLSAQTDDEDYYYWSSKVKEKIKAVYPLDGVRIEEHTEFFLVFRVVCDDGSKKADVEAAAVWLFNLMEGFPVVRSEHNYD